MNKKNLLHITLFLLSGWMGLEAAAQEVWNVDRCMSYAVAHNRTVRQRELEADNARMDRMKAIGSFLPGVSASTGIQYNFGRSVDPETNTYNTVSTFNNAYSMEASMPIFRGGGLVNEVRRSKAAWLMGKAAWQESKDNTALETFQAYIDALYCYGTLRLARKKLVESDSLLYKTRRQEELGLKGLADVAQMEAQQATDSYNLTHQRNLYETALLTLKQENEFSGKRYVATGYGCTRHTDTSLYSTDSGAGGRCVPHRPEGQSYPASGGAECEGGRYAPQDFLGQCGTVHYLVRRYFQFLL